MASFYSSSSIIFFLLVLTLSFRDDEFVSSLQVRLIFGVATLIVTITTMAAAFIATCFLIFNHTSTWVTFLVASLGFITLALFVMLLYTYFGGSLYWSRHLFHPTNYYQRIKSQLLVFFCLIWRACNWHSKFVINWLKCVKIQKLKCFQEDNLAQWSSIEYTILGRTKYGLLKMAT